MCCRVEPHLLCRFPLRGNSAQEQLNNKMKNEINIPAAVKNALKNNNAKVIFLTNKYHNHEIKK